MVTNRISAARTSTITDLTRPKYLSQSWTECHPTGHRKAAGRTVYIPTGTRNGPTQIHLTGQETESKLVPLMLKAGWRRSTTIPVSPMNESRRR